MAADEGRDRKFFLKTYESAVRILGRRDHSRAELKKKLELREFPSCAIHDVLNHLVERGWLKSDDDLALQFSEQLLRSGLTPQAIRTRLQRRGYPVAGLKKLLETQSDATAEKLDDACLKAARQLQKRVARSKAKNLQTEWSRERFVQQSLLTRGFSLEQSRKALLALKSELQEPPLHEIE